MTWLTLFFKNIITSKNDINGYVFFKFSAFITILNPISKRQNYIISQNECN